MSLTDRIHHNDRRTADLAPIVERRVPRWVERMQDGKLPNKDMTGRVAA